MGCWPWSKKESELKTENGEPEKKSKRPANTQWGQQTLPAWPRPVKTKLKVVLFHLLVTVICVPVGIVCLYYGGKAHEISVRYDHICPSQLPSNAKSSDKLDYMRKNAGTSKLICQVNVTLDEDMNGPIYVLYQINGMHQNHRRYVRSHLDQQMASDNTNGKWEGVVNDATQAQSCVPVVNYLGNSSQQINPCGLVAWSFFNDTYDFKVLPTNSSANASSIYVSDEVSFKADTTFRFANYYPKFFNPDFNTNYSTTNFYRGGGNLSSLSNPNQTLQEAQRFQVWMRLSQLPTFRKLWGVMGGNYSKGTTFTIDITNQYNTYQFDGQKHLVLSTTSWLGGHSFFLGAAYVAVGALNIFFAIAYLIICVVFPRPFGDVSKLVPTAHYLQPPSGGA